MAFTTPCFVRVEDPAERKKLIEWLEDIGYNHLPFMSDSDKIATDNNGMIWLTDANRGGAYDCGTSVELFRALAAMNDENDLEQWFVVDDGFEEEIVCSKSEVDYDYILSCYDHRKATAEEIVEYFKKREK